MTVCRGCPCPCLACRRGALPPQAPKCAICGGACVGGYLSPPVKQQGDEQEYIHSADGPQGDRCGTMGHSLPLPPASLPPAPACPAVVADENLPLPVEVN